MYLRTFYPTLILLLFAASVNSQPPGERLVNAFLMQDYNIVSNWSADQNRWIPAEKHVAVYNERNRLIASLVINAQTKDTISKTTYIHNERGQVEIQFYREKKDGVWKDIRYLLTEYDENSLRNSIYTYIWQADEWKFSSRTRQHNLIYDDFNRLLSHESQNWTGGEWLSLAIDYNTYDEAGDRVYQIRKLLPSELNSYQVFYTYTEGKMLTRNVQNWNRNTSDWIDSYRDYYSYDQCGLRTGIMRERYVSGTWVNSQKTEYFYRAFFPPGTDLRNKMVAICHNGQTIYVSVNALPAHIAHGDCLGACPDVRIPPGKEKSERENPQFTIYPNPARDYVTISFEEIPNIGNVKRIELSDAYGKRIRSYNVSGQSQYLILRGNLLSGTYYIKIISNNNEYVGVVIFE